MARLAKNGLRRHMLQSPDVIGRVIEVTECSGVQYLMISGNISQSMLYHETYHVIECKFPW